LIFAMFTFARHALSILLMPFMVVVVLPQLLRRSYDEGGWGGTTPYALAAVFEAFGAVLFVGGFALFSWCVGLFAGIGKGTLAPWDPTQRLVAVGPYRFVRNPMISAVAMMLLAQAVFYGSAAIGAWFLVFLGSNHIYFVLSEEPGLEKRFGDAYRAYKNKVPRWIPRLRPRKK
jgi:protein-S-isoprenylcysteine O-methyltransferase Ste14